MKDFIHEQFLAAQQAAVKAAKEDALETSVMHARRASFYMNLEAQVPRLLEATGADDILYESSHETSPVNIADFESSLTDEEKEVHEKRKEMHLGGIIRSLRERRGLNQTQLADRIGVSKSLLSLMETRKTLAEGEFQLTFPESERTISPQQVKMLLEGLGASTLGIDEISEVSYLMKRSIWEAQERRMNRVRRHS